MPDMDKEFVEYVVRALVDNPDDVKVRRSVDDMGVLLELAVNPDDMGKVIGKAGATAKSIRTLLRVLGSRSDARVNLKIVEPEGSEPKPAHEREEHITEADAVVTESEPDAQSELLARTKREFADLDDLDL
ncbi:MAG TPA: KH domain-containing protein [Candidatus Saccharimonadia bacterium]|nr:KH domain-containing protein [Candidatus Saccharimonadia bacterium]